MQAQENSVHSSQYRDTTAHVNQNAKSISNKAKSHQEMIVKRDWRTTAATFVAGGVAGACSRTLTAPLDRIKIIVQEGHLVRTTHPQISAFKTARLIDVFELIRADGGWRAFWRGNGVNCMKAGPEFAIVFTLRRFFSSVFEDFIAEERRLREERDYLRQIAEEQGTLPSFIPPSSSVLPPPFNAYWTLSSIPRILINFYIGASAGFGAQLILYPLEVVKTRIAVSKTTEFRGGIREVVVEAYRTGGIREFYRGIIPNMVGIFIYRGFEVGIYSTVQQRIMMYRMTRYDMNRHKAALSSVETAVVGMGASMVAQTISYPLNVVRTRLQTQGTNGRAVKYNGMVDCFVKMIRTKGPASLFSGITANYLKAIPASASMFVVFEKVQNYLIDDD